MRTSRHWIWSSILLLGGVAAAPFYRPQSAATMPAVKQPAFAEKSLELEASGVSHVRPPELGVESSPGPLLDVALIPVRPINAPLAPAAADWAKPTTDSKLTSSPPPPLPPVVPLFVSRSSDAATSAIQEPRLATISARPRRHTVRDGDDLRSLSRRYYGNETSAERILSANRTLIADPTLLPVGAELTIPSP